MPVQSEPIVGSPESKAPGCVFRIDTDAVVIGREMVQKETGPVTWI